MRIIACCLVLLLTAASGRLLACDYSCVDHTRATHSSEPSCHQQEDEAGPVAKAGLDDCADQSATVAGFVAGKIASLTKPALAATPVAAASLPLGTFTRGANCRRSDSSSPVLQRIIPLRI
jgi:hypothetical protein